MPGKDFLDDVLYQILDGLRSGEILRCAQLRRITKNAVFIRLTIHKFSLSNTRSFSRVQNMYRECEAIIQVTLFLEFCVFCFTRNHR